MSKGIGSSFYVHKQLQISSFSWASGLSRTHAEMNAIANTNSKANSMNECKVAASWILLSMIMAACIIVKQFHLHLNSMSVCLHNHQTISNSTS